MKISELSRSTKFVLLAILTAGAIVAFYLLFGLAATKFGEWNINRQVNSGVNQSKTYQQEAANNNANAANAEVKRSVEDGVREKVIAPKIDHARRNSNNSKAAVESAKRKYENEKLHPQNLTSDSADNCADLRRLFPDTTFADCR